MDRLIYKTLLHPQLTDSTTPAMLDFSL